MPTASRGAHHEYHVPARFSIAEILAMMTVFGLLFGGLRLFHAPAWLYLFLGTQGVVICLVQMRFGAVPRGASTLVGAIFLPTWMVSLAVLVPTGFGPRPNDVLSDLPFTVPFGGLLGYCTGTLAAGVFLITDALQSAASRRKGQEPVDPDLLPFSPREVPENVDPNDVRPVATSPGENGLLRRSS